MSLSEHIRLREVDVGVLQAVERSERIDCELNKLIEGLELIATDRRRVAGGAFLVALAVHTAISALIRQGNTPVAFILSRSIWEATVRGFWLLECATDGQIQKFIADTSDRKTWDMIKDLEATGSFEPDTLSSINAHNSRRLNAMNHVGGPLLIRCNSERGIELNFDDCEKIECLENASALAILSALGIAQAAVNSEVAQAIFKIQSAEFRDKRAQSL